MTSKQLTHKAFAELVAALLNARDRNLATIDVFFQQRIMLTVAALKMIARGGHGPTWAKTTLKMYDEE